MPEFEVELPGIQPLASQERQGGVCRLGDALSELLSLYPSPTEMDDDLVEQWPSSAVELFACESAYSASRA